MLGAVKMLDAAEVEEILRQHPYVAVVCEYCQQEHQFDREAINQSN